MNHHRMPSDANRRTIVALTDAAATAPPRKRLVAEMRTEQESFRARWSRQAIAPAWIATKQQGNAMASLTLDRLDQVFSAPSAVHCWHRLHAARPKDTDHTEYREVVARLHAYVPPNPESRFLQATFLHSLTHRQEYLGAAAVAAREILPLGIERLHALLLNTWAHALSFSHDRSSFCSVMTAVEPPELLRLMSRDLERYAAAKSSPRQVGALRRAAIVTSHVNGIDHAPTATALKNAGLLREAGIEAELFAMQELNFTDMPQFLGGNNGISGGTLDPDSWLPLVRGSLNVHIADPAHSLIQRWIWSLSQIDAFDPDIVLFIGFFSPLPYLIYPRRPLIGLSVHSLPPIIPSDVWLTHDPNLAGPRHSPWSDSFPPLLAHTHPFRIFVKPAGSSAHRDELKLPADACVLLTLGELLPVEISRPWGAAMLEFLDRHPDVHWLLVGGDGILPPALASRPTDRIRTLAHHSEVRAIGRCCDIFVNPPRMGGGFSVATAMAEGLPVVAYTDSDGGDKLGPLASTSDSSYFETLEALVAREDLRQSRGAELKRHFFTHLDIEQGRSSLLAACEKAIASFNQRNATSN